MNNNTLHLWQEIPADIRCTVNDCLQKCLISTQKQENKDANFDCKICVYIFSIVLHFGKCGRNYNECGVCTSAYMLIHNHFEGCLTKCQNGEENKCDVILCKKIVMLMKRNAGKEIDHSQRWNKIRKYLQRLSSGNYDNQIDPEDPDSYSSLFSLSSYKYPATARKTSGLVPPCLGPSSAVTVQGQYIASGGHLASLPSRPPRKSMTLKTLEKIPESRMVNSDPIATRTPDGKIIIPNPAAIPNRIKLPESYVTTAQSETVVKPKRPSRISFRDQTDHSLPSPRQLTSSIPQDSTLRSLQRKGTKSIQRGESALSSLRQSTSSIPQDANLRSIVRETEQWYNESVTDSLASPLQYNRTGNNFQYSLPLGPSQVEPREQLLSLVDRPTGVKGIGEVVYGTREQLLVVTKQWMNVKEEFMTNGTLHAKHYREEGVILSEFEVNNYIQGI